MLIEVKCNFIEAHSKELCAYNCYKYSNFEIENITYYFFCQADDDEDTFGNVCDTNDDKDRDGVPDSIDNCPDRPNADQVCILTLNFEFFNGLF